MAASCLCTLSGYRNQPCATVEDHVKHWSERLSSADRRMLDEAGIPENPILRTSEDEPED